jgi:hypothetical protein
MKASYFGSSDFTVKCIQSKKNILTFHDKLGIQTGMVSYLAKFALREILMFR